MISVGTRVSYVFAPREYGSAVVITFSQSAIDLSALSRKEKGLKGFLRICEASLDSRRISP